MTTASLSLMYQEACEAPARLREQQLLLPERLQALLQHLRKKPPRLVMVCARGSSDHAGVFLRYLIETQLQIPTASAIPSTFSIYGAQPKLDDVLVVCISQSGQSPDLVNYAAMTQRQGATVVGLINRYEDAPLAEQCHFVLPLYAGNEVAVAATKSYLCTLHAALFWIAHWSQNQSLLSDLSVLPDQLVQAQALDWSAAVEQLADTEHMLVLGRGPGLGFSHEAALKFKETCALHAESFSAAEVLHGPLAMIKPQFKILAFDQGDKSGESIRKTLVRLHQAGASILLASSQSVAHGILLPVLTGLNPWSSLITQIQTAYLMIEQLCRQRGLNPDAPPHIAKVTKTL